MIAASVAMMAIVTSNSISVNPRRRRRCAHSPTRGLVLHDTQHLLDRGQPGLDFSPAIGPNGREPALCSQRAKLAAIDPAGDRISHLVRDGEQLKDPESASLSRAAACRAAQAAKELHL